MKTYPTDSRGQILTATVIFSSLIILCLVVALNLGVAIDHERAEGLESTTATADQELSAIKSSVADSIRHTNQDPSVSDSEREDDLRTELEIQGQSWESSVSHTQMKVDLSIDSVVHGNRIALPGGNSFESANNDTNWTVFENADAISGGIQIDSSSSNISIDDGSGPSPDDAYHIVATTNSGEPLRVFIDRLDGNGDIRVTVVVDEQSHQCLTTSDDIVVDLASANVGETYCAPLAQLDPGSKITFKNADAIQGEFEFMIYKGTTNTEAIHVVSAPNQSATAPYTHKGIFGISATIEFTNSDLVYSRSIFIPHNPIKEGE